MAHANTAKGREMHYSTGDFHSKRFLGVISCRSKFCVFSNFARAVLESAEEAAVQNNRDAEKMWRSKQSLAGVDSKAVRGEHAARRE
jgi:hypothetical protein